MQRRIEDLNIKELIRKANLNDKMDKKITFENKRMTYTIARKKHEFFGGKTHSYAEYYLFELNDEIKTIISDYKRYKEFQIKLLAPYFYKYMNDLRWNLYLIFLIEDEECLRGIDVGAIENDDNYARKFFFDYEESLKFLEREDLLSVNKTKNKEFKAGQFQQWVEILDNVKLTGCLTEAELKNENIDKYLDSGSFEDKSFVDNTLVETNVRTRNKTHTDKVVSIEMGEFREHCFQQTGVISFGQVNLLQGPNGCGKTSITEAIELAVTNDIKRLKDMKEETGNCIDLKAILKSNSDLKVYNPGLTSSIYKRIDSDWYGVPNVDKSQTTLNKNFNRFNYLDADAANRLTREQSLSVNEVYDYKDGLKKLFFDNETVNMEKRWYWYYDKFTDKQRKLNTESDLLIQEISVEKNHLNIMLNSENHNIKEIISFISAIKYNNIDLLQSCEHLQSLRSLDETLSAVNNTVAKLYESSKLQKTTNYMEVLVKENEKNKDIVNLKTKIFEAVNNKKMYTSKIECEIKLEEAEIINKNKADKEIERLERDILLWQDIKNIMMNPKRLDDLRLLTENIAKNKKTLSWLSAIKIKYQGIENIKECDISNDLKINIEAINLEIISLENQKNKLVEKIEKLTMKAGQVDTLRARLKALGEEYLQISGDDGICPLCGHSHSEKLYLENNINNVFFQNSDTEDVKVLEKERNNIDNVISQNKKLLLSEEKRLGIIECIIEVYNEIYEAKYYKIGKSKEDIISILYDVQRILEQDVILKINIKKDESMIEQIRNEGYTTEKISISENYKKNSTQYTQYVFDGKDINFYLESMLADKNNVIIFREVIKDKIKEFGSKIINMKSKADQYESIENEKCIEIEYSEKILQELSGIKNYFLVLRSYFNILDGDDIFLWIENFNILKARCTSEINYVKTEQTIKESKEKIRKFEGKKLLLGKQIERCITANNAFKLLSKLDDAVYDFFENNKERIIFFFQMLHRPKEFENKLEYDEKGYFKLIRKGKKDEVRCPQMSTGQRVSFTLSVFFSLHLSAVNAPGFIMLDEPVANLDDVHLLNLIDILRDFALKGIQIFFTTANQDVAGLFRRKFSFFEEEFVHFKFERINNLPVTIRQTTYNPMEDVGKEILLQAISGDK